MTLRSFGRAVPIHMHMLSLVGYECAEADMRPATTGNSRKNAMREGRHSLVRTTGIDFGYDVAAWRDFLKDRGKEFGYKHPYAFASVDRAVQCAMNDPSVIAALAELAKSG